MSAFALYEDIQARTGGEVYLAVVGPVRTGKSTFIRSFLELVVLPRISEQEAKQLTDQLPLSGLGKTITTVEPKFIPKSGVRVPISEDGNKQMNIRVIDCVGYMVAGAIGQEENGQERLVRTPWQPEPIPFSKAGEIGTRKVIYDHATVGLVMTTDGSFGELPGDAFAESEARTIRELSDIGKPFVVLMNTATPNSTQTKERCEALQKQYDVPVLPINAAKLRKEDVDEIFSRILSMFPIVQIAFQFPKWLSLIPESSPLFASLLEEVREFSAPLRRMKDIVHDTIPGKTAQLEGLTVTDCSLETGCVTVEAVMEEGCYYEILSNALGQTITNERQLIAKLQELLAMQEEYTKVAEALRLVNQTGYGVVKPGMEEIVLAEPELIHQGSRFGIKIRAVAPSVQMIRTEITTEIAPIVGSEEQAKDLIRYMEGISGEKKQEAWNTNVFGKTMGQMVEEGISLKVSRITEDSQRKLRESMEKIVNESNGGLVCFII